MSHPVFTLAVAMLLAGAMAAIEDRTPRERAWVAARFLLFCVAGTVGGSWLMHLIHG
jgi:hypothetical protein